MADWLPNYSWKFFKGDLIAGLTVGVMVFPQGMAVAMVAGLDPIYGLYAGLVPLLVYPFFGSSRQLSVGPVALVSVLILAGVGKLATPHTPEFTQLAIATGLIAGILQILLGFFRLGFLINFLSHPVLSGFTSAAAVIIAYNEVQSLLGLSGKTGQIHWLTLIIGLFSLALIMGIRRLSRQFPTALLVVALSTVAVWVFGWDVAGVTTIGIIPKGLPAFTMPVLNPASFAKLLPLAFSIGLISFIESLAIARTLENRHKNHKVRPDQELLALGLSKVFGAFFQAYPTTGSFTRSAVNDEAGAQTGMSSIVGAGITAIALLFLTPFFYFLPKATLSAIVIAAVFGLINIKEAIHLWRTDKRDFLALVATFAVTLSVGIQAGIFSGMVLSLGIIIYQNSRPHVAVLGRLPDTGQYKNIHRFPEAEQQDDLLIIRFDAQLYFANAHYLREIIERSVGERAGALKYLLLDASSIHDIDSSGFLMLKDLSTYLKNMGIGFYLCCVIGPVRDQIEKSGFMGYLGHYPTFLSIHEAIAYLNTGSGQKTGG